MDMYFIATNDPERADKLMQHIFGGRVTPTATSGNKPAKPATTDKPATSTTSANKGKREGVTLTFPTILKSDGTPVKSVHISPTDKLDDVLARVVDKRKHAAIRAHFGAQNGVTPTTTDTTSDKPASDYSAAQSAAYAALNRSRYASQANYMKAVNKLAHELLEVAAA